MIKLLSALFLMVSFIYALDDLSVGVTFQDSTVMEAPDFNDNFTDVENAINALNDSLEIRFVRFIDFDDTLIGTIYVDTIRSNPDVDSIQGNPYIDSAEIDYIDIDSGVIDGVIIGANSAEDATFDSLQARTISTSGAGIFSGTAIVDSLASTKGITATTGDFSGTVNVDSLHSNGGFSFSGNVSIGTVSADSVHFNNGIAGNTGNFSGTVNVDSLHSSKGIVGTYGTFTNTVNVDSLHVTNGIFVEKNIYSDSVNTVTVNCDTVNSLVLKADSIYTTSGLLNLDSMDVNKAAIDSIKADEVDVDSIIYGDDNYKIIWIDSVACSLYTDGDTIKGTLVRTVLFNRVVRYSCTINDVITMNGINNYITFIFSSFGILKNKNLNMIAYFIKSGVYYQAVTADGLSESAHGGDFKLLDASAFDAGDYSFYLNWDYD